ncbi:hypothetical protein AURDEDRAFT_124073 [Auricularia subglabra TFB-10046 SS5]|nr:hypothetical protein AURDEDRAFT_124073 [Auricularia subglabra TFB-10046 SS5]
MSIGDLRWRFSRSFADQWRPWIARCERFLEHARIPESIVSVTIPYRVWDGALLVLPAMPALAELRVVLPDDPRNLVWAPWTKIPCLRLRLLILRSPRSVERVRSAWLLRFVRAVLEHVDFPLQCLRLENASVGVEDQQFLAPYFHTIEQAGLGTWQTQASSRCKAGNVGLPTHCQRAKVSRQQRRCQLEKMQLIPEASLGNTIRECLVQWVLREASIAPTEWLQPPGTGTPRMGVTMGAGSEKHVRVLKPTPVYDPSILKPAVTEAVQ